MMRSAAPFLGMPMPAGLPSRDKQSVALKSLATAFVLMTLKTAVGLLTGSLGILSEAAHSALDLLAAAITYVSVRLADKPADASHPFGHGKIESLSAFAEMGLLLATCAWIVGEAVWRLFFRHVEVVPTTWAFAVMVISIVLDTLRSRALFRVARRHNSPALEADALHFSTDVYSSSAVIFGLLLVFWGRQRHSALFQAADPLAALVVAGITLYLGMRLGKRTVDTLVDAAPPGTSEQIAAKVSEVQGVLRSERIRVRQSGQQLFVDLTLTLPDNIPFEHAQSVVESVELKVRDLFPSADVSVHAAPRQPLPGELVERVRTVAHRSNFQIHDVKAYETEGRVAVSLDLEVDPELSLEAAHDRATRLEGAVRREVPEVARVAVHIEPLLNRVQGAAATAALIAKVEPALESIVRDVQEVMTCRVLEAHRAGPHLYVSLRCTLDPRLDVERVHDITESLEFRFRQRFPEVFEVTIHAEPSEARHGPTDGKILQTATERSES